VTKKTRVGQELDASAVELVVATEGSQPGQNQIETLRRDCQLRNAEDSYHQLFSAEIGRAPTGNARD